MNSFDPGPLVMVDLPGKQLDAATADFLQSERIRAVCLFRKNLGDEAEVRRLTAQLREVLGPRALIGLDQEGGSVVRSTFLPQAPSAMALGAAADPHLAEQVGAAVARGLRALGVNWNFAPVLDVNNNPANPVIAERAFSDEPDAVARLAGAWMQGSLTEGVACCVKHFPGHGDTHMDSHLDLPWVDKSRAEHDALELRPFKALRHQAPAMMTAHIVYPQLDAEHPATLSRVFLQGILRDEWGYDGVVITDALMMKAIADRYGYARAAVMAIAAGADMVLAQGSLDEQRQSLDALRAAFKSGQLTLAQGARAQQRLDDLAARYPLRSETYAAPQREQDDALMHLGWAQGLTALRGAQAPSRDTPLRVLVQTDVPTDMVSEAGPTAKQVLDLFDQHFSDVQPLLFDDIEAQLRWHELPQDGRHTVLVSTRRHRYGPEAGSWRPDLHLVLWNPFQALDVPSPAVVSYGYAQGALVAVKDWLQGRLAAGGQSLRSLNA
jgi:beta-N-acetylhexosaminidase